MPEPSSSDQGLVAEALRDRQAYALIVRRWHPVLSRYLRRFLSQSTDATDDVLQDVFIKAYLSLNSYDQTRPFGPCLSQCRANRLEISPHPYRKPKTNQRLLR